MALPASKKWWASLSAEQQAAVQKAAEETRTFERADGIRQAADVVGQLKAKGMSVTDMPTAETKTTSVALPRGSATSDLSRSGTLTLKPWPGVGMPLAQFTQRTGQRGCVAIDYSLGVQSHAT